MSSILNDLKLMFFKKDLMMRLILINVIVFVFALLVNVFCLLLQLPNPVEYIIREFLMLPSNLKTLLYTPWSIITYMFLHSGIFHILFNMLGLWWFGRTLEQMYGSREFLWFYLVAAVISGLAYVALDLATNQGGAAIGASGSIMAVLCLFAWHFPTQTILVFFVIPLQIRWLVVIYAVFDFSPVLMQLAGEGGNDGIAHAAHAGGLIFGLCYGWKNWRLSSRFEGWNRGTSWRRWKSWFRRRPKLALHRPNDLTSHQSTGTRLDELLSKISEQGEASLTPEERQFLIRESERLKRQR